MGLGRVGSRQSVGYGCIPNLILVHWLDLGGHAQAVGSLLMPREEFWQGFHLAEMQCLFR